MGGLVEGWEGGEGAIANMHGNKRRNKAATGQVGLTEGMRRNRMTPKGWRSPACIARCKIGLAQQPGGADNIHSVVLQTMALLLP